MDPPCGICAKTGKPCSGDCFFRKPFPPGKDISKMLNLYGVEKIVEKVDQVEESAKLMTAMSYYFDAETRQVYNGGGLELLERYVRNDLSKFDNGVVKEAAVKEAALKISKEDVARKQTALKAAQEDLSQKEVAMKASEEEASKNEAALKALKASLEGTARVTVNVGTGSGSSSGVAPGRRARDQGAAPASGQRASKSGGGGRKSGRGGGGGRKSGRGRGGLAPQGATVTDTAEVQAAEDAMKASQEFARLRKVDLKSAQEEVSLLETALKAAQDELSRREADLEASRREAEEASRREAEAAHRTSGEGGWPAWRTSGAEDDWPDDYHHIDYLSGRRSPTPIHTEEEETARKKFDEVTNVEHHADPKAALKEPISAIDSFPASRSPTAIHTEEETARKKFDEAITVEHHDPSSSKSPTPTDLHTSLAAEEAAPKCPVCIDLGENCNGSCIFGSIWPPGTELSTLVNLKRVYTWDNLKKLLGAEDLSDDERKARGTSLLKEADTVADLLDKITKTNQQ